MGYNSSSPSLKTKIRSSACFSCCFRSSSSAAASSAAAAAADSPLSILRSSSTWLKTKAHDLPEIKNRCKSFISRVGKGHHHHHRRGQSAEFGYDPLSYALNFDEGNGDDEGEAADGRGFRYRNFSARLPASPPNAVRVAYG